MNSVYGLEMVVSSCPRELSGVSSSHMKRVIMDRR